LTAYAGQRKFAAPNASIAGVCLEYEDRTEGEGRSKYERLKRRVDASGLVLAPHGTSGFPPAASVPKSCLLG